ncbi:hypothetical protein P5G51_013690 [Virgibacillus sp. 179-BFC.A HS]|uniref:Uncharacterized protein n=1 Tax=Tigheibacillus jepli TaxID=3035914 RepID=A0ABU5CIY0_9BACI|nr:hypothetical protein [Virgibacillus sp. 179-BFC.A HS]MDY0406303.1 hypothetical protein [Virgibacillus sp. 179-BFC.A HS]
MRLQKLLTALNKGSDLENIGTNFGIKGALRAYFDTSIVESYEEPLVKELDKLETMINKYN